MVSLVILLMVVAQFVFIAPRATADVEPGYVTLLFARAQMRATDGCQPLTGSVSLLEVAAELASRGLVGSAAVVTNRTDDSTERCFNDIGTYASWDQLATLRDDHGWTMVSTGRDHRDMTALTPSEQYGESCGSLDDLEAHGHDRGWGLFGYANDKYTSEIQEDVVSTCFAYGRAYSSDGTPRNQRAELSHPWLQSTMSVNGGKCNDASLACYSIPSVPRRYMSPGWLGSTMTVGSDEWMVVQTYRFVDGANLDPASTNQFDCTSPDWRQHWTLRPELYCFNDYLQALDTLAGASPAAVLTDPATVAEAWGRGDPDPVPDTTPPNGTVSSPAPGEVFVSVPVGLSGSATDDVGVGEVRVAVKDRLSGLWYRSDGSWGAHQPQSAVLAVPGGTATGWSFDWLPPPGGSGSYGLGVTAVDSSGNVDPTKPWINFTVSAG